MENNFTILEVDAVEELDLFEDEYVYDLELDDNTEHIFFANDILVHNSCFLALDPLIQTNGKSLLEESGDLSPTIREKVLAFDDYLNEEIKRWAQKELNSADPRLVFKREAICDKAVFMEKKRYILHVINQEDVPSNYFKYVGVEIARSTMSKEVKELVKAVLENAILNGDRKTANAIYQKAYEEFKTLPIEAQAFRSKISDLEKQELKRGSFGEIGKHTPSHAKSAIFYNDFLKRLQIDAKYPAIGSGIKMKWFYTAKNPYNLKNMGFIDVYPPEIAAHIQPDLQKMFDKSVAPPITRLYECVNWQVPSPGHETTVDLFELFA